MNALPDHVHAALFTDIAGVADDCRNKVPMKTISEKYGLSYNAIKIIRRRAGIVRASDPPPKKTIPPELLAQIPDMYRSGMSMNKIAQAFGTKDCKPIRKILVDNGVEIRDNKAVSVHDDELGRFATYLDEQKYARSTAQGFVRLARIAIQAGTTNPDEVDEKFPGRTPEYRGDIRQALRRFREFRKATP